MTRPAGGSGVQLAEVVAAIALGADLGLGQPLDHMLRSTALALRMADHLGVSEEERAATYWVTLFMTAGCTGTSWELSRFFGDDIAFRQCVFKVGASNRDVAKFFLAWAGKDRGPVGRTKVLASILYTRMTDLEQTWLAHCAINGRLADRLGLGDLVVESLLQTFARWDGRGLPKGLAGDDIALAIRIANLANHVEVIERDEGFEASCRRAKEFAGNAYDPLLVDVWCTHGAEFLEGLADAAAWDAVVAASPRRTTLSEDELDDALELIADYADLKSPWFTGHSRGVAGLAAAAARKAGLPEQDVTTLRRAALVHDLGRNGVPNTIWDKAGPLTDSERERVRLHAYYTDRVLHRAGRLAPLGAIASAAHERSDGSGYPRAVGSAAIPMLGRFLEAADAYQAMREDRPHRPALSRDEAAGELRRGVREGCFDGAAADAVLAASGHPVRRQPATPGGLTAREVEVLLLAARGGTTKAIGSELGIAPKTVGNHIERIYAKVGISSRAEAAMYAMQHGLLNLSG